MTSISIITPWHNCSELTEIYEPSHLGAEIISIDNASEPEHATRIKQMTERMGGWYIPNKTNNKFAQANNQGYKYATKNIIMFLNSDVAASSGWVYQVEDDVKDGALYGVSAQDRSIDDRIIPYIEGWCIAATRATWNKVGLWDETLPGMYWEDNILCLQALKKGVRLETRAWPVRHISNYTTNRTPGALDGVRGNQQRFEEMVRACQF